MLLTPRAPSAAAKGALWLRERFEELVEAVVAGLRLRHFAGSHVGRWLLPVIGCVRGVAAVEQRGQSEGLRAVAIRLWRAASTLPYAFQMFGSGSPTSST